MRRAHLLALLATLTLAQQPDRSIRPAAPARKLALLIGNNAYPRMPLQNAVNDATSLAAMLTELGFTADLVTDANRRDTRAAIDRFIAALRPGDVALFYYSGHGIQVDNENYLLPTDFTATDEAEARDQGYSAGLLHERMQERRSRLSLLILDACRDNPFRTSRSATQGWATMRMAKGSLLAFATAPGAVASDGPRGVNGLFTKYLLEALREPGLKLNDVFDRVREKVDAESDGKQTPFTVSGVIGTFVFRDPEEEDRKRRAEIARMEGELKRIEAKRAEDKTADKVREAEALRAKIEFEKTEAARLKKESEDRQAALAAGSEEARRKEDEKRLAELRNKVESVPASGVGELTWEQARAEADGLEKKIEAVKREVDAAKEKAVAQLDGDYAPAREKLNQVPSKDQFETTAQYQARLDGVKEQQRDLERKYAAERLQLERRYADAFADRVKPFTTRLAALKDQTYRMNDLLVEFGDYDADRGIFTLQLGQTDYTVKIQPDRARALFLAKASAVFRKSFDGERVLLIEPGSGAKLPASRGGRANPKDGLKYVWIAPGSFLMGCSPGDSECGDNEKPTRPVGISRGYWLAESEVTQAAFEKVVGKNPSSRKGPQLPVEQVNWNEAVSYCRAIGGRLPTEAEWEFAARAGSAGARYGDMESISWTDANSGGNPHAVKQKEPNAWGVYDMLGNVWEWVEDLYPGTGYRTMRGGSFNNRPRNVRSSLRYRVGPGERHGNLGFRCVWE
jgi:formylglycine-generating enzyme required for sulfatase activity